MKQDELKIWIESARPKTLFAALAPVMIGAALAYADGGVHVVSLILIVVSATLIQIGTNLANDYYDFMKGADTADRRGPTRATQAGLVSPVAMRNAFLATFGLAVFVGFFLVLRGGVPILVIGSVSVVCGILYTAGPYPLSYIGIADFFVLVFFGPVAVGGTYYLQRGTINPVVIAAGLAPGLVSVAILTVNNFRDYETDKTANKKTLVVRFGRSFGIFEYIFCFAFAMAIPIYLCISVNDHYYSLLSLLILPFVGMAVTTMRSNPSPEVLNKLLAGTARLLIIFSVLFSIGWII
ncbi:MAG: 1,4-dihydroxy-2-naphthoate polyprenyltransferase [Anaerohalosphaera sp.]|nr:1,4-dihydroxy-2-naphthoate polyprenyltransferase [Anaerohalosphaera sp.]